MDYYYGQEAEMFTFYRLPKILFTDPRYKPLSTDAKLLYGLMLDRMGLSVKNGWQDAEGKTYIYMRQEEAMELLDIKKDKAIKIYRELEKAELIKRKKQGLTHPDIIYIGRLTIPPEAGKTAVQKSEKTLSRSRKNRVQELRKTDVIPNKTEKSNLYLNQSIYQSDAAESTQPPADTASGMEEWKSKIKLNIDYGGLSRGEYGIHYLPDDIDALVTLMADECDNPKPTIRIGGVDRPRDEFRRRVNRIDTMRIMRILDTLAHPDPDHPIYNRRAYLLTMLYNHHTNNPTPTEE